MRKRVNVDAWISENQGKHNCGCGCGKSIVITRNHRSNGIPRFIVGHSGRVKPPKNGYLSGHEKEKWVLVNQRKHRCRCGCNGWIEITKNHYQNGIPSYIHGHQIRDREYPSQEVRFWAKVKKGRPDECWAWLGSGGGKGGYGHIRSDDSRVKGIAHRLSYLIHNGELDADLDVLHRCDNPNCVNPAHLFQGTHKQNMEDASRKGRFSKKLKLQDVLEIVKLVNAGERRCRVARLFSVGSSCITEIMSGRIFSTITGIPRAKP